MSKYEQVSAYSFGGDDYACVSVQYDRGGGDRYMEKKPPSHLNQSGVENRLRRERELLEQKHREEHSKWEREQLEQEHRELERAKIREQRHREEHRELEQAKIKEEKRALELTKKYRLLEEKLKAIEDAQKKQKEEEGNKVPDIPESTTEHEATQEEKSCTICFARTVECVLIPCNHKQVCTSCLKQIQQNNHHNKMICPVCRTPISKIIHIFE